MFFSNELTRNDIVDGENFKPSYLQVNPRGTVPSLTSNQLAKPLTQSADILEYLDSFEGDSRAGKLIPTDITQKARVDALIERIHGDDMSTNILLFLARDTDDLNRNKLEGRDTFLANRQRALEKYHAQVPGHPFYLPKLAENGADLASYQTDDSQRLQEFFAISQKAHNGLTRELEQLDEMIVLPFAAGPEVTAADLHLAPWFSHALMAVGAGDISDLTALETFLQRTLPSYKLGNRLTTWWATMNGRPSFKTFFPKPR